LSLISCHGGLGTNIPVCHSGSQESDIPSFSVSGFF
jgi:hypothetical protein